MCRLNNFKTRFYNFKTPVCDIRDKFKIHKCAFIVILQQINQTVTNQIT